MLSQGRGVYSSITICSRYIHVVVLLLLLVTTRCTATMMHKGMCVQTQCGDQTQTALLVGEEHKHTSTSTKAHTGHTGQRGSAWESNPCIPLALLIVFGLHIGNQWNTLPCYLTLEFSTTRCPCTMFSCYVILGGRRRWRPKLTEGERETPAHLASQAPGALRLYTSYRFYILEWK